MKSLEELGTSNSKLSKPSSPRSAGDQQNKVRNDLGIEKATKTKRRTDERKLNPTLSFGFAGAPHLTVKTSYPTDRIFSAQRHTSSNTGTTARNPFHAQIGAAQLQPDRPPREKRQCSCENRNRPHLK
jgi:hypothetical protein